MNVQMQNDHYGHYVRNEQMNYVTPHKQNENMTNLYANIARIDNSEYHPHESIQNVYQHDFNQHRLIKNTNASNIKPFVHIKIKLCTSKMKMVNLRVIKHHSIISHLNHNHPKAT